MYSYDQEKMEEWLNLNEHSQSMLIEQARLTNSPILENHEKERLYFLSEYFERGGVTINCIPNGVFNKLITHQLDL